MIIQNLFDVYRICPCAYALVPEVGVEPTRQFNTATDFKSVENKLFKPF